jgi:pyruvate/2-oxoglutarate dehydrogenase complex dihydrolipoamide dehydrogenase (E3) component
MPDVLPSKTTGTEWPSESTVRTAPRSWEVVADNLIEGRDRSIDDRILSYGLFIDPPLARIGMTETQAREADREVLIGKMPMSRVGRARERSETRGFMKVLVDADTEQILGPRCWESAVTRSSTRF